MIFIVPLLAEAIRGDHLEEAAARLGYIAQEESEAHPALSGIAGKSSYREAQ